MGDTAKLDDPIPGADEAALKSIAGGTILVGGGDNLYQGSGKVPDKNGNTAGKEEQGTISSGAVSYTHLDVYKRQIQITANCGNRFIRK